MIHFHALKDLQIINQQLTFLNQLHLYEVDNLSKVVVFHHFYSLSLHLMQTFHLIASFCSEEVQSFLILNHQFP